MAVQFPSQPAFRGAFGLVVSGFLVLGTPGDGLAQIPSGPRDLPLEEAIRLAHDYNPGYRIQEGGLATLDWQHREALAAFVPTVNASSSFGFTASGERRFGDVFLGTQPAQLSSGYNLGLSLNLNGSTFFQPGIVRANEAATRARVDGASAELVDQVTRTYLSALRAEEELQQARTELDRTRTYVRQAEAQVTVGAATPLDLRRAEVQEGQAQVLVLQAENAVADGRLALMQTVGVQIPPEVQLSTRFEIFEPELNAADLIELALEQNPALRASRSETEAARSRVRASRSQYLPSASLSAGWSGFVFQAGDIDPLVDDRLRQLQGQYEGCLQENRIRDLLGDPPVNCSAVDPSNPDVVTGVREQLRAQNRGFPFDYDPQPFSLSVGVSIPIFTGFSRQLQIEEARVAEDNARHQVRAEELRVRAEVERVVRTVESARRLVALQARIRETSSEELRLAQERFRLGLGTSIEVVDAQANLSQAERDEINAVYDFHGALAELEALVGMSLR